MLPEIRRWPFISGKVAAGGKPRRPGAKEPRPPLLVRGAVLKLLSCGTVASNSGVLAAPINLASSRDTLIRPEPVGGTPRMLEPVTMISESLSAALSSTGSFEPALCA